jgi:hypothetical protein
MLKRTKGRFLLTLLVITGLAGTLKNTSLTQQERKTVVNTLKDSKSELLKSVKGLSETQLDFKASPASPSIGECISHVTTSETSLWKMLGTSMEQPADPEKRAEITIPDEALVKLAASGSTTIAASAQPVKNAEHSASETISTFKALRADHIKYVRSTTEDLRNHFVCLPFGRIDSYQLLLLIAAQCNHMTREINEIKAEPGFPKS